jgi:orotate phosphoribosyltransferase
VLLIDDTWTTGNHVQSASTALKAAGAGSVATVVLGRHLNINYGDTAAYVEQARLRRFDWDPCAIRPWSHA